MEEKDTGTTTPNNARNPKQKEIIQEYLRNGGDPFDRNEVEKICNEHDVYNEIIHETKHWYVMPCLWPLKGSQHHIMIVCQRNIKCMSELTSPEFEDLFNVIRWIIMHFKMDGGAFCMRFGDSAISGTTVTHLHGHVIEPDNEKEVRFHIGNFNNPSKGPFETSQEEAGYNTPRWKEMKGVNYVAFEYTPGGNVIPHYDYQDPIERDLWFSLTEPIAERPIKGGAFCMRFGTASETKRLKGYLITPNEGQTLVFTIKKQ